MPLCPANEVVLRFCLIRWVASLFVFFLFILITFHMAVPFFAMQVQFDLVSAAFTLSELPGVKDREEAVLTLWRKTSSYLVGWNVARTSCWMCTLTVSLSTWCPLDPPHPSVMLHLGHYLCQWNAFCIGAGGKWDQRGPSDPYGGQRHFIKGI